MGRKNNKTDIFKLIEDERNNITSKAIRDHTLLTNTLITASACEEEIKAYSKAIDNDEFTEKTLEAIKKIAFENIAADKGN
jgi:hypothetical protein